MEGLISKMKILKSTPPSFRRRENAAAIVKAPPPGALTKGPDRKFPGLHPPPVGATSPSLSLNKRFAIHILAFLAVLAVGLLFLLPGGLLQAQDANGPIEYAENGTAPVATYTAVDPERTAVKWSLKMGDTDYPDDGDFTIDPASGVLRFAKTPNYESPADMDMDNTYQVIVVATDATRQKGEKKVTVEVTNVNEDGTVKLSALQPAPGVEFSATLTDIDNIDNVATLTSGAKWQWARSQSKTSGWSDIDKATKSMYEPKDGDADYYLRALVKYTDAQSPRGAKDDKTASMISAYQVVGARSSNEPPEFTDQDPDESGVQNVTATRDVPEDAEEGRLVGDPVDAEDDDSQDKLTYTLDDGSGNFDINRMTGQISVAKGAEFDHADDDPIPAGVTQASMYEVTVIATDPTGVPIEAVGEVQPGNAATITVTINVTAVDEAPVFTAGEESILFAEDGDIDAVLGDAAYTADDPEDQVAPTLKLGGADRGKFSFDPSNGELRFEAEPNFEKPGSADGDNTYEVTVMATDGVSNSSDRDVKVIVTNSEEGGMVTLSRPRPRVGVSVMASLDDLDGGEAKMKWQWWKTTDDSLEQAPTDVFTNEDTADEPDEPDANVWQKIDKATSDTYTPVEGDAGRWLVATVLYTDAKENPADAVDTANRDESRDKAYKMSDNAVGEDTRNLAPAFLDQDDETPGTQNQTAVRKVSENTEAGMNVGNPVTAEELDPNSDPLIYTLEGPDAGLFDVGADDSETDVDEGGQIKVGAGTKLDYEASKTSYMVTVKAEDSYGAGTTIMVTIMVTPVDEPPEITGDADAMYPEKGTADVATYTAVDPERTAVKWSLKMGDTDYPDDGDFTIDPASGVLRFAKTPNYESPADMDMDNTYQVIVVATDATRQKGEKKVTVEVANVNEDGTVKLSALQPAPGVAFSATLTDIDNVATDLTGGAKWQWARSQSKTRGWSDIDKATKSMYEPKDGDADYYLRALAKYADAQSTSGAKDDKTASMISAYQVVEPRSSNEPPEFTDQDPDESGVQNVTATRDVPEDAEEGRLVGDPVDAEDDDSQDKLTYTLDDGSGNFDINRMTGQISVAKGAEFDHADDDPIPAGVTQASMYEVTVIATDPTGVPIEAVGEVQPGNAATITVTINVTAVDEAPVFTAGEESILFAEDGDIDAVLGDAAYTADDPEDQVAPTLKLGGADRGKFSFDPSNGELRFEAEPNFEKPGSADGDNTYEVTVTATAVMATDGVSNSSDRDVKVIVTNSEEGGMVTLSRPRPRVGVSVMASLGDLDGGEAKMKWQWWKTTDDSLEQAPTDVFTNEDTADEPDEPDANVWQKIDKATSDTYTPVEGDAGRWLVATVLYTDANENPADAVDTANRDESRDKAYKMSDNAVGEDTRNLAPAFLDQDDETPGTQNQTAVRKVSENTEAGMNVGNPVTAEELDPNSDPLIYTLEGPDAGLFDVGADDSETDVDEGGQIKVGAGTKLDYEASRTSYMVTVKAEDSFGDSASIMVTIMVTPVDEPPEIMRAPDANVAPEFASATTSRTVAENTAAGEDIGNPVAASDANGDTLTYALVGTDAASFNIGSATGQLMTLAALDYETKVTYSVMVTATDPDSASDMITVTITVTNVDEMGEVTLWAGADALTMAPQVGDTITGAVMDPDGGVTGESWQWARTMDTADMSSWMPITGATDAAYIVTASDTGYYLRVMATYTDAAGTDMAMEDSPATMMVTAMMTVPMFDSETATREVAENTEVSMDIGDPVMGTDADGDTLIYALGGTDAGSFYIDPETGQLKTLAALDYETKATYSVMVTATDPDSASDMITVTITVTNVDEPGMVTLWAGTDALTMAPQVGETITGAVMDPDGGVTGETWQWAKTMTPDMMDSWMPITGATDAAYMVTAGDTGYHLRVMATYTDAAGTDMAMEDSMPTMMVTAMMTVPMFDSETATREVAENTEASMDIGDPVMGTDADGDTLIYALGGTDAGSFYIDPETGQLKTLAALDYETKATYSVMVTATDPDSASDMITVTITVTNVDEPGMVTLWAGADALTMAPQVGDTITGAVMDPDGGVTGQMWQWSRTMDTADMSSWMPITGATDAAYMVTAGDTGYYLRVMATYTDAAGTDMAMEYSMPTMMVTDVDETQPADFDPLAEYDADKDGELDKDEVIQAINDYLFGVGADAISKDDVIETINLYLFG